MPSGRPPSVPAVHKLKIKVYGVISRNSIFPRSRRKKNRRSTGLPGKLPVKEEFDIECSLSSTYRLLHRIKLSWLVPRPRHPEADVTAQAEFSQLLDCN